MRSASVFLRHRHDALKLYTGKLGIDSRSGGSCVNLSAGPRYRESTDTMTEVHANGFGTSNDSCYRWELDPGTRCYRAGESAGRRLDM